MTIKSDTPNQIPEDQEQRRALAVAMAAKKVLRYFHANEVEVQQYRLQEQDDTITVTALDGRGQILRLQGQTLSANLSPEDFDRFRVIKDELPQMN